MKGARDQDERHREALIQAGLMLSSELSLPAVLQKIVDLACEVADARYGALGVLGPRGRIRDFVTHGVTADERRAIADLPTGEGILGLLTDGHSLRLARLQDHPESVGFPPHHPSMTTFLGVPLKVGDRVFGNLYLTEKRGGSEFTAEDQAALETLAAQAAAAIENARLYEESRARQQRLEAINEITHAILEGRDVDEVLRLIAQRARDLVGAALATVTTPESPERLVIRVADGARADALEGRRFPADDSISGQVMHTRRPLLIPDATTDKRAHQPVVRVGGMGPCLFVPLIVQQETFGTLLVANLVGEDAFTDEDLGLVRLFAAQASVALEYARIRENLQRLAVLEDRERIAQELHDGVIQSLFAVGMSLQTAEPVAEDPAAVRARIAGAVDGIDGAIRDLRNYIFALRPGTVADRTLDHSLRELVDRIADGTELSIDLEVDEAAASLLAGRATDVLQAAREALSNAVRHSGGSKVGVRLVEADGAALLEVQDDGSGFDPGAVAGKGQGLESLASRANSLGGALEIDSGDRGTIVRIRIPV